MSNQQPAKSVAIIGAGPAGLMAAEVLSQGGVNVDLFDAMPSAGRKFLMAGKGGMNITHSESYDLFVTRYGDRQQQIKPFLDRFEPDELRKWLLELGIETFVGTSGRVFPAEMKAAPLLRAWLHRLRLDGVNFYMRHRWIGWVNGEINGLRFITPAGERIVRNDAVVLALGGASWPKLGSTGAWLPFLQDQDISVATLKPANCGFQVRWSEHFRNRFAGAPVKSVSLRFISADGKEYCQTGEFIITRDGMEGSLIYAMSSLLRDTIESTGAAIIYLDLMPDRNLEYVIDRLSQSRGKLSVANYLRKRLGIQGVKAGLLRELASAADLDDPARLGATLKALPISLVAPGPIEEAISCAGGVTFDALDEHLMIRSMPGIFCAGEMLDWEAPTGGYLLNACLATGRAAGLGALEWLHNKR